VTGRALTAWAVCLPLAAGGLLVGGRLAADRAAAVAVPTALRAIEDLSGARITAESASAPHPLSVVIRGLRAERNGGSSVDARRVRVELAALPLLTGRVVPSRVVAEGVRGAVTAGGSTWRWSDCLVVASPAADGWTVDGEGWVGSPGDEPVPFRLRSDAAGSATLELGEALRLVARGPVALSARRLELPKTRDRVRLSRLAVGGLPPEVVATVDHVDVPLSRAGGRRVSVGGLVIDASVRRLTRLLRSGGHGSSGGSEPGPAAALGGWTLEALGARLTLHAGDRTWTTPAADLRLVPGPAGVASIRTALPQLGPEARGRASVPLDGLVIGDDGSVSVRFEARLADGRLSHPAISPAPLRDLSGQVAGSVRWSPGPRRLELALDEGELRGASFALEASVEPIGSTPRVSASLRLPEQPCQALVSAIPDGMLQRLVGFELSGRIAAGLDFAVDMAAIEESIVLEGHGDPADCVVADPGAQIDVAALNDRGFVHRWPRADGGKPIRVGPGTRGFVPIGRVPAHVRRAMVVTEDGRFWRHSGVNLGLVKKALRIDLEKGRYVYGGSTITQQLVKNLFFGREKTLSRKLEEAVVALQVERVVDKARILELYVNVIEFGPDVYGLRQAARYYFDKPVERLTPVEGAFLATIKPKPSAGPRLARQGRFRGWWHYRVIEVMGWLEDGGFITPLQRAESFPFYPTFRGRVLGRARAAGGRPLKTAQLGN